MVDGKQGEMPLIEMRLYPRQTTPVGGIFGRITLGAFRERFAAHTTYWGPTDYVAQWTATLEALRSGATQGTLITSLRDPAVRGNTAFSWPFYRDGTDVVFRNQILFLDEFKPRFDPNAMSRWAPERTPEPDVSEWRVPLLGLHTRVVVDNSLE